MTALNFVHQEDQICIALDTLSIEAEDHKPFAFMTKFILLPHLHTILTGTGFGPFVSEWMAQARSNILAQDIEHLNQYAPDCLLKLASHYPQLNGTSATIYHFGYSQGRDKFLGYAYRSTRNWISEEIQYGIGMKPVVPFEFENSLNLPKTFIELMELQREEDLKLPKSERIGIGGEIHFIIMNRNGINVQRCHRFSSYDEDYKIMCNRISEHNQGVYADAR